ncbi:MAG: class I SAM-dependent DNA methyltransferase [Bacillota bacterium]
MSYTDLASIYDYLMEDIDYHEWTNFIARLINFHGAPGHSLLDAGCGTGSITTLLAQHSFKVTGIDISEEMLTQAEQKSRSNGIKIPYFKQDIRNLSFREEFDIVVSTFDTLNYLIEPGDIKKGIANIYLALKRQGIFIFDINSHYKLANTLSENVFTYNTDELVYIWENCYDEINQLCQMDLTFFALDHTSGKYLRFNETHMQKAFYTEEICTLLMDSGFEILGIYGELAFESPMENEERIFFAARKKT